MTFRIKIFFYYIFILLAFLSHSALLATSIPGATSTNFLKEVHPNSQPQDSQKTELHLGGHNDYCPLLYEKYFGKQLSYENWKKLPKGTKQHPLKGKKAYVVSLTTWPPRTQKGTPGIWLTIESLMRQATKPDRIILWLALEDYPNGLADLPQTLLDLQRRGLEIKFIKENIKAAKKLLPALANNIKANIITADDDIVYKPYWLQKIKRRSEKNPGAIVAITCRTFKVKHGVMYPYLKSTGHDFRKKKRPLTAMAIGFGGVLYPYDVSGHTLNGLHPSVLNVDLIQRHALDNDDPFFYLGKLRAKTPLVTVGLSRDDAIIFLSLPEPLFALNGEGGRNDKIMRRILNDFPAIAQKLGCDLSKPQCVVPN